MKKLAIILLLLSGMATTTYAQNLSKMSEKDRNETLVKTAKEAIKKYAPDYCKYIDGNYKVCHFELNSSSPYKQTIYCVKFIDYNKNEESFREGYAVSVNFREKDGSIESVVNGQGYGIFIPEGPLTRSQEVPKLEYKRQPPYKQNADGSWDM